jgi:hypothetical protein
MSDNCHFRRVILTHAFFDSSEDGSSRLCLVIGETLMDFDRGRDSREETWVRVFGDDVDVSQYRIPKIGRKRGNS